MWVVGGNLRAAAPRHSSQFRPPHSTPFSPHPSRFAQGEWSRDAAYAYLNFVLNFSQIWALYCLAGFYLELRPELNAAGLSPLGKVVTVKAIVFFSWWCVPLLGIP